MAMRETVGSMRAFFFALGTLLAISVALSVRQLVLIHSYLVDWLFWVFIALTVIILVVCVALFYAGTVIKKQIESGTPKRIQTLVLAIGVAYLLVGLTKVWIIYSVIWGRPGLTVALVDLGFGVGITVYLYFNARRLAKEAVAEQKEATSEVFA